MEPCLQPNSIEFDLALDWRQLLGVVRSTKQALCQEQAAELAQQLAKYLKVGPSQSQAPPTSLAGRAGVQHGLSGPRVL